MITSASTPRQPVSVSQSIAIAAAPRAPAPFHDRPTSQWQSQPSTMAAYMHPATTAVVSEHPHPHYETVLDFTYQQAQFVPPMASNTPESILQNQYANIQGVVPSARLEGEWKQSSFYSYRPNEVKHRKRTTRHQLKILEETFRKTQKPDSNIRKTLALQLNMTPRNVQVWFQNRRAKDKTLAKRALKAAEEEQLREAQAADSMDQLDGDASDNHPNASEQKTTVAQEVVGSSADSLGQANSSIYASPAAEDEFLPQQYHQQPIAVPTPVRVTAPSFSRVASSGDIPPQVQAKPSVPLTYPLHDAEAVVGNNAFMGRDILAPRGSLPLIRTATALTDIHHQRSVSSPIFPCNVDSSNLSLIHNANGNGVHSLYHQQQYSIPMSQQQPDSQNMFHMPYVLPHRVPRIPSGPLPAADFTFGASPLSGPPSATSGELEDDDYSARFASHDRLSSITCSDSSIASYSQFSSAHDGELSNSIKGARREDETNPLVWYDGRRGSASHIVDNFVPVTAGPPGVDGHPLYPSPVSQGISPRSAGYSSGSPRPCTALSVKAESVSSDSALYIAGNNNWTTGYPEYQQSVQSTPLTQTPSPHGNTHDVRDSTVAMAFQHGMYGYAGLGEQQATSDSSSSVQSSGLYLSMMPRDQMTELTPSPTRQLSLSSAAVDPLSDATGTLESQYAAYQIPVRQPQGFSYETMAPNYYLQACQ